MSNDIENVIVRVLIGTEDVNDLNLFSEWYNASDENRKHFLKLKNIYDRLKGGLYPKQHEIYSVWDRIDESIKVKTKKKLRVRSFVIASSVAAVALVFILLSITYFRISNTDINWVEFRSPPRSAPQTILLSDGSTVIVNASSYLRYPEKFSSDLREVYLDGEAFFKVKHDENSEFVVHTDKQSIKVLGTEFNVLGYSSDSSITTTLAEGKIQLLIYNDDKSLIEKIDVLPKQQTCFDKNTYETAISEINIKETMAWIDGVYSFRDASLNEITNRIGKVTGVVFEISDETLSKEEYTGKFFYYQTAREIIEVLNFKDDFRYQINSDTVHLSKK